MGIQSLGLNSNSPNFPKHKFEEHRENSWIKMIRGLLWNKIQREELETGDHIFTYSRGADRKVHHGIYVNDKLVIHFNGEAWSDHSIYPADCFHPLVLSSCIDCFLSGGDLYRFEYGVNPAHFLAKLGRGRTLASADKAEDVKHRASFLFNYGFGASYRYINNGEDFAVFCKTGLLVVDVINFKRSWQIAYFLAVTAAVFFSLLTLTFSFTGLAARFLGLCCICIFAPDIGARPNVIKFFRVYRLPEVDQILEYGGSAGFRPIEIFFDCVLSVVMLVIMFCILSTYWIEYHQIWFRILPQLVWTQAFILFFYWAVLQRRLLSNKIREEQLRRGDHIYTWRNGFSYAHHGIYVGDGCGREVIHLVRGEDPVIPCSSSPSHSHSSDSSISTGGDGNQPTLRHYCHVEYCSIDSFVDGGELNLYKYGVNLAFFMAKTRGGTCTHVKTGPPIEVLHRAHYLQKHDGFGAYNLFNNNCEDFAIYCKTSLLSPKYLVVIGRNGQIASLLAVIFAIIIPCYAFFGKIMIDISLKRQIPPLFWTKSFDGISMKVLIEFFQAFFYNNLIVAATTTYILYCLMRYIADLELDNNRVPVERLNSKSRLADWFQSNFCHFILSSLE